jgi:TetR/AcrR family transcriptional regulator, fatty acid metabolism regulator protein
MGNEESVSGSFPIPHSPFPPYLPPMPDPPLTEERAARRRQILNAAVEIFAEQGFFAARTREIAAAAGVAEGTIYLYFDGKDDLLLTAFRERVREFSASVAPLVDDPAPFAERLTRFFQMQLSGIEAEPALATVLLMETRQSSKFYGEPVREVLRDYASAVDGLLERGIDEGALHPDLDVPLARRVVIGALEEIELDWLLGDRVRPLTPRAEQLSRTLMAGFGATSR